MMDGFPQLDARYRVILCDLWGCVHDGYRPLPGVIERLRLWNAEGRTVLFLTNAPRSSATVREQLAHLGIGRDLFADVVTAGDAGVAELAGRPVGFVGTPADRGDLTAHGLVVVDEGFSELAFAGLTPERPRVEDFRSDLEGWRARDILMHCLNPDRVVVHGGERMVCAGAIADAYEALGGVVHWYGKPYAEIYREALRIAGDPSAGEVLAIGDGLATDMLGAAKQGIDAIYVAGGIHAGEPFPADFAERHGINGWAPIATVGSIGAA
jgi:HAD superfamily hydrolase (TIGR01450 family)